MRTKLYASVIVISALLTACGGGSSSTSSAAPAATPAPPPPLPPSNSCAETDVAASYACKTGASEALYNYQWALKLTGSFFSNFASAVGGSDLNVEAAHLAGIKGQKVPVLVLDDGVEIKHEDLAANVDPSMSYNFNNGSSDPSPLGASDAHGTNAAGIIAAAQNGKGIMGIAPRVSLGAANLLTATNPNILDAYGGAAWASKAHVINASYGSNPSSPPSFDSASAAPEQTAIRAFPNLRGGKGLIYVKATGNEFDSVIEGSSVRDCPAAVNKAISCENPAHDTETLESNVITVAAANARGIKSSYSSAGSVNWITGLGGEYGDSGSHGQEGDGPSIFSTDLSGCSKGYSLLSAGIDFLKGLTLKDGVKENPNCDYAMMNGTSAATPTISGVVALMLSANPALSWRDVREILRATAKKIDPNYGSSQKRDKLIDLSSGNFSSSTVGSASDLQDAATLARLEYGWQKNAAGFDYANAYGFGLADASAAVAMAKTYTAYRPAALRIPAFSPAFTLTNLSYGRVSRIGTIALTGAGQVDAVQLRLSGPLCIGSVGVMLRSPAGTVSALAVPYNVYYKSGNSSVNQYALSSYAFFGEPKAGNWEVFLVSGTPIASGSGACSAAPSASQALTVEYRILDRL